MPRGRPPKQKSNAQPRPRAGLPKCPSGLNAEAKKIWKVLVRDLKPASILTTLDADILARYCFAMVRLRKAEEVLEKTPDAYKGPNGGLMYNLYAAIWQKWSRELSRLGGQLGLDPANRQRLRPGPGNDAPDPKDKFFSQREGK
jgi:P27 family predicted phage terminase small subunit